jgi:hypothetical protein
MRPDDIPEDVWGVAENAVYRFCNKHHLWGDLGFDRAVDLHETIARAIMAAKAEAYTDAADLAQRMGAGRKSQGEQAKIAKKGLVARDFESMAMSAFDVSTAIRKRGEVD